MRGASHQPTFPGSCLTISHTCFLCPLWANGSFDVSFIHCSMVLVPWKVGAILGDRYGILGQNYVALLSGSGMPAGNVFILEYFNCKSEGGEVGKVGKVGDWWSWEGGKDDRVVRWKGGRFLILLKGERWRVSPRFYLFVSDINQGNKKTGWV